jgi:guanylate kinase
MSGKRSGRAAGAPAWRAGAAGTVFVVSAPSGAGKTTLCKRLVGEVEGLDFSVSFTTRRPRATERAGVDYHFVDRREFERRRRRGEFVEWAMVNGDLYGTSAASLGGAASRGRDILLDIDTQGAANVRRLIPDSVLIFILPPSRKALRERLLSRGSEDPEALEHRLGLALGEVEKARQYDFVIINDDLEAAYTQLRAVITAARCRRERQEHRLESILREFAGRR